MRTLSYVFAAALALAGCGGNENATPDLSTGTGTGTLIVKADITSSSSIPNVKDPQQFSTSYVAKVWKVYPVVGQQPLPTATVTVKVGDRAVPLVNDVLNGHPERYVATETGVAPNDVVTLDVEAPNGAGGTDAVHGVTRRAPGVHYFTAPDGTAPISVAQPLTITWIRPVQADVAHLRLGNYQSDPVDTGTVPLPANTLQPDQSAPCSLDRTNTVQIAGAVPGSGSSLDITVTQDLSVTLAP